MVVSIKVRMNLELFSFMQAFMKTAECKKKSAVGVKANLPEVSKHFYGPGDSSCEK